MKNKVVIEINCYEGDYFVDVDVFEGSKRVNNYLSCSYYDKCDAENFAYKEKEEYINSGYEVEII